MWLRLSRFVALAAAMALSASSWAQGQGPASTWAFQQVLIYNKLDNHVTVIGAPVADTKGGYVNLIADGKLTGDGVPYCPGGNEQMQFTWVFTRDVRTLTDGDRVGARLTAHVNARPPCVGNIAAISPIVLAASHAATSPLTPDLNAQADSDRFVGASPGGVNYAWANRSPQATDAAVAVSRDPARANANLAWFAIDIGVRSGGDLWLVYMYKRVPAGGQPPQPQPQPQPPGPGGGGFTSELNVDHRGGDYANFDLPSADPGLCQAACAKDSRCVAYTYVKPYRGAPAHCWLKNVLMPGVPSDCCVSGARTQAGPPSGGISTETGVDRPGSDYSAFDLPQADAGACRTACANDGACRAYTYVRPGVQGANARCYLKNAVPRPVPRDCCTSGVKQ
jgi:hypothetical protein